MDFKKRPVNLLGYKFCELEVRGKHTRKTTILAAKPGAKSIVGRDLLNYLQYAIEHKKKGTLNSVNSETKEINIPNQIRTDEMRLKLSELFERRGIIKHHNISDRLYQGAIIKQLNVRWVPVQLQDAVKKEVQRLLQERHIIKVSEIKHTCFSTQQQHSKEDRSVKIALDAEELNKNA